MSDNRERLSNRRATYTEAFTCMGMTYQGSVGFYDDGRVGEVFLNCGKTGTLSDILMKDMAVCFSIAVQHGADWREIKKALCHDDHGNAEGPLGKFLEMLGKEL